MRFLLAALLLWGAAAGPAAAADVHTSTATIKSRFERLRARLSLPKWRPAPMWIKRKPHLLVRKKKKYATAVGQGDGANEAAARAAAEAQGRAELQKFVQEKLSDEGGDVDVSAAEVVDSYTTKKGRVFVRLEMEAP